MGMELRVIERGTESASLLASALDDTPETAISCDRLRRGFARAFVFGDLEIPRVVIMQSHFIPSEPIAFGDSASEIWSVLRTMEKWECVNAPRTVAAELAELMESDTGQPWTPMPEIHYQLDQPFGVWPNADVRRLALADTPIVEAATEAFGIEGWRFGSAEALLRDGFAAGAVVANSLVAVAFTTAITGRFGEVGVSTLEPYRGRSYSTAAAALVSEDVQSTGRTPIWSTGEYNLPSRRIAEKLGFREVSRRIYLNPPDVS